MTLKAPFPWPGGKSRVAPIVWEAFGPAVNNYVEPFYGSGAVLLGRPGGAGKIETANDIYGGVVNVWRALAYAPDEVARVCDWPVSELDMHAVHPWLVERLGAMRERLRADRKYFDVEVAGWWLWGISLWIGTGWCSEPDNHKRPSLDGIGKGVHSAGHRKRPSTRGGGIHSSSWHPRPHLTSKMGVHQLPKISVQDGAPATGGVHSRQMPSLGNDRGVHGLSAPPCRDWFRLLQARLRNVRWVCGDWRRVLGPSVLGGGRNVGGRRPCAIFFDPPYDPELRSRRLYADDDPDVSRLVREWCLKHGDDPTLRIALCGYLEEHEGHMPDSWRRYRWVGARGYAGADNDNREKETIWFSPHCNTVTQLALFEDTA